MEENNLRKKYKKIEDFETFSKKQKSTTFFGPLVKKYRIQKRNIL